MSDPTEAERVAEQLRQAAADLAAAQARAAEGQMQLATSPCNGGPQQ